MMWVLQFQNTGADLAVPSLQISAVTVAADFSLLPYIIDSITTGWASGSTIRFVYWIIIIASERSS
jgi:hypothetical protein